MIGYSSFFSSGCKLNISESRYVETRKSHRVVSIEPHRPDDVHEPSGLQ